MRGFILGLFLFGIGLGFARNLGIFGYLFGGVQENLEKGAVSRKGSYIQFERDVLPLLESRCSYRCHGLSQDKYRELKSQPSKDRFLYFPVEPVTGKIDRSPEAVKEIFERIRDRGHGQEHEGSHRIDYSAPARFSPLARIPLNSVYGGLPHKGVDIFQDTADEGYRKLIDWLEVEIGENHTQFAPQDPGYLFFKKHALPVFVRNGCFLSSCHGPDVFNDLKLLPPLPGIDSDSSLLSGFSEQMIFENRRRFLGATTRLANLGGDVSLSRLITKNLPVSQGGIHQRGGNTQFFDSMQDRDVKTIQEWLSIEKREIAEQLTHSGSRVGMTQPGEMQGILFLRAPKNRPSRIFEPDVFQPGTHIFLLKSLPGVGIEEASQAPINLTEALFSGAQIHIQGFDVGYDGKSVVMSLRKSEEEGFRLFEFMLDENLSPIKSSLQQISFDPPEVSKQKRRIHHLDPAYIPGPDKAKKHELDHIMIAFSSNLSDEEVHSLPFGYPGEAEKGDREGLYDLQRTEASGTFEKRTLHIVSGKNAGEYRKIVRHSAIENQAVGSFLRLESSLPFEIESGCRYFIEEEVPGFASGYEIYTMIPPSSMHQDAQEGFEKSLKRITFNSSQNRFPTVRSDGEIMFTSLRNLGFQNDLPVFNAAIYRVQAGGFDYHIQGGNRSRYPVSLLSREMPQGLETRLLSDPRNCWGSGALALADHGLGVNMEPDNPLDGVFVTAGEEYAHSSLPPRFLPTQILFDEQTGVNAVTHTGLTHGGYKDPYPLSDGQILVSFSRDLRDHLDPVHAPDFDLYLIRFRRSPHSENPSRIGTYDRIPLNFANSKEFSEYSPKPFMVRLKEESELHQKFYEGVKTERKNGVLRALDTEVSEVHCYDYHLLQSFLNVFAPSGPKTFLDADSMPLAHSQIHYVRILERLQTPKERLRRGDATQDPYATGHSIGIHAPKRIIAEIPLQKDGSFYARIPANVPLIIQGLNQQKMALHSMHRFFYTQPGEKLTFSIPKPIFSLRCSGCHGSLSGKLEDGVGTPDLVTSASQVMANFDPDTGYKRPSQQENVNQVVTFMDHVQPILNARCVSCHSGVKPAAGLDLEEKKTQFYSRAYENIMRHREGSFAKKTYVAEREGLSSASFLIKKLLGMDLPSSASAPSKITHPMENPLTEQELLTIIRWIDSGAVFRKELNQ